MGTTRCSLSVPAVLAAGLLLAGPAGAEFALNLPPPATEIARKIYDLHTLILWICFGIFLVVFVPMFYALWRHRKSAGHAAQPFHEHPQLEIAWTIAPALILIGMAVPTTSVVLAMKDTGASDLTVKVTARQWKWEYEYLGEDVRFASNLATPQAQIENREVKGEHYLLEVDRPLVVPTGRKVRLVLTAEDVIHAWWVPTLGVKQDAIPGFVRDAWFRIDAPGTYRGQCAELCGVNHAFMPVVVEAVPPEQYAAWLDGQKRERAAAQAATGRDYALAELVERGKAVYAANCAACHQENGKGLPGTFPALDGSPLVKGPTAAHLAIVLDGKPGTAMQAFAKQLSDLDLAAVVSYERNAWGNQTGDAVQPRDVAALRK
ncbi:cytochrome c oxidase subunit II [Azospira restricta]|uniref:Cytochrome c oxidase subunit 2 n=1 Tax=Azospira restricta TaxID=404405 RepID=A0A974PXE9_9RHOO|nr:cytochrome c oxidase subunit II [Azospira restricta]QRJ63180.1 cytochrome c oxidase subunit II [Azospira restricta]